MVFTSGSWSNARRRRPFERRSGLREHSTDGETLLGGPGGDARHLAVEVGLLVGRGDPGVHDDSGVGGGRVASAHQDEPSDALGRQR